MHDPLRLRAVERDGLRRGRLPRHGRDGWRDAESTGPVEPAPNLAERRRLAEEESRRWREDRRRARQEDLALGADIAQAVALLRSVRPDPKRYDPSVRPMVARVVGGMDKLIRPVKDA